MELESIGPQPDSHLGHKLLRIRVTLGLRISKGLRWVAVGCSVLSIAPSAFLALFRLGNECFGGGCRSIFMMRFKMMESHLFHILIVF